MRLLVVISVVVSALSAVLSFVSCNTAGCTENRNAVPLAEFCNSTTGDAIALDSVEISGVEVPSDTVLTTAGTTVSQVYLPMRPTHNSLSWCIAYRWKALDFPELNDTIEFDYDSDPYFASEECGVIYRYHITRMSHTCHLIDSVAVVDSLVTNIDKTYVKIYFRVSETEE